MKYWSKAVAARVPLGEIDQDELVSVLTKDGVYYVAGFIVAASGEQPEEEKVVQMADTIRSNVALEMLRRQYALNRPKLFPLRNLPVSELDRQVDVPEREFMLGLAYTIRQQTGQEITAEEAAEKIDELL